MSKKKIQERSGSSIDKNLKKQQDRKQNSNRLFEGGQVVIIFCTFRKFFTSGYQSICTTPNVVSLWLLCKWENWGTENCLRSCSKLMTELEIGPLTIRLLKHISSPLVEASIISWNYLLTRILVSHSQKQMISPYKHKCMSTAAL